MNDPDHACRIEFGWWGEKKSSREAPGESLEPPVYNELLSDDDVD